MIEAPYYETMPGYQSMSKQDYANSLPRNDEFWGSAAAYASKAGQDRLFASEMAYMIVTLYRTGV